MENINLFGIGGVAAIVVICLLIGMACKATSLDNKWIPVICGVAGGALGVLGMHIMPDFPAQDYITSVAVGIVSGLGATGAHQVVKQLSEANKLNLDDYKAGYENLLDENYELRNGKPYAEHAPIKEDKDA